MVPSRKGYAPLRARGGRTRGVPMARARRRPRTAEKRKKETFDVVNPATGKVLERHPIAGPDEVRAKVARARQAYAAWAGLPPGGSWGPSCPGTSPCGKS